MTSEEKALKLCDQIVSRHQIFTIPQDQFMRDKYTGYLVSLKDNTISYHDVHTGEVIQTKPKELFFIEVKNAIYKYCLDKVKNEK